MLSLRDLRHDYDGQGALSLRDWDAGRGEHWLVLGASGCGKTTLLHIIAGLLRPTSGTLTVDGQELAALKPAALDRFRARRIGIVLQKLHLIKTLSVLDNVLLAQYLAGLPQDRAHATRLLAGLGLAEKAAAMPRALSQGEAQRVAIARAVVNRPALLLADEPTASLDDAACDQVLDTLFAQAGAVGATLLIATHDQRVKRRVGQVLELAPPA
ncbi:MAG: ABC transporter ATP-binding protein [Proteobacteria bacterium]|nr:ABC transporter ATP-binding protein [Pseudomonadota bacterium]